MKSQKNPETYLNRSNSLPEKELSGTQVLQSGDWIKPDLRPNLRGIKVGIKDISYSKIHLPKKMDKNPSHRPRLNDQTTEK